MKRPLALTLALILMSTIVLPVLADGEDFADSPDEFVPEIMSEHYISDRNYAIAFKSMYDGETWLYNACLLYTSGCVLGRGVSVYPTSSVRGVIPEGHIYKSENSIVKRG